MSNIDIYNLKASEKFPLSGREEKSTNLELTLNPNINSSLIKGLVTSEDIPLSNAIVKLYDYNFNPFAHSNTDEKGEYIITDIPFGSYFINSTKKDYITSLTVPVAVSTTDPIIINISLESNIKSSLNTLFGRVRDTITGEFISNATVNIFSIHGAIETLVTSTKTNDTGQYLAPNLKDGIYFILVYKQGFFSSKSADITLTGSQISNLDFSLTTNPKTNTGTVNGIITDKNTDLPIASATIALYLVNESSEAIIQLTETNSEGRYLFGNVEPGNYIVKAIYQG